MSAKLKVFFNYRPVEQPWGGANSFLRALKGALAADPDLELVERENDPCDVYFLNQLYRGPGRPRLAAKFLSVAQVRRIARWGTPGLLTTWRHRLQGSAAPGRIVCRLVNHAEHAYGQKNREQRELFRALPHTHADIFQTQYLHEVFRASGYAKPDYAVIHNAVDQSVFHARERTGWHAGEPLVVISSTMTRRKTKRFDLIAALSAVPGVESYHAGIWPEDVPAGKVKLLGQLKQGEIADFFRRKAHVFMHPAEKDICPNAVIEAMSCGLPVFYSRLGGTAELVGESGIALEGDLPAAVARMTAGYQHLVAGLQARHSYFSIQRAAAEYKAVFLRMPRTRPGQPTSPHPVP